MENAIDANSSHIDIDIERGGSALIRITDDGDGIDKGDLTLAVSRHATSKLQTLNELEKIVSLGFRGEALASISAVSKLTIQSKPKEQEKAWMLNTGTDTDFANYQAEPELTAHPIGTTVVVRDLFFNTPARRKFMRTIKTEFKHIDDIVKRIALSQFNIAFKLSHNKKIIRNLPKAVTEKAIAQRISKLYSPDFLLHAHQVDLTSNDFAQIGSIRLHGWISHSDWHRNQPDWQYFYVNGRFIRDKLINHALRQAYQELLPADTYAAYLLYLEINPEQVDVNVHPTKHEVRFRQTRLVHDFIFSALSQALGTGTALTSPAVLTQNNGNATEMPMAQIPSDQNSPESYSNRYSQQNTINSPNRHYSETQSVNHQAAVAEHIDGLQKLYQTDQGKSVQSQAAPGFLGQPVAYLNEHYLLSQKSDESNDRSYVIHIIRAQQFLLKHLFQPESSMPLLIPQTISLSEASIECLMQYECQFNQWGLELSQLSGQTLVIRSLPAIKDIPGCQLDNERLIQQLLIRIGDLNETKDFTLNSGFIDALVQSVSTKHLSVNEQEQLLNVLSEQVVLMGSKQKMLINEQPVFISLDKNSIEQLFKSG